MRKLLLSKPASLARKVTSSLFLISLILLISACDLDGDGLPTPAADKSYDVAPVFREYYNYLGGEAVLGVPISDLILYREGELEYQYTEAALMVHDPQAPNGQPFHLAPLATLLGISEPPVAAPEQPGLRYIDGHVIYRDFLGLYEKLGGARTTGKPLTEVHLNRELRRFEQYFENVGFYRLEGESPEAVHLLAYGVLSCDAECRSVESRDNGVYLPSQVGSPFEGTIDQLGRDFTGLILTEPYQNDEHQTEQVLENVVITQDGAGQIFLQPLPLKIGQMPGPLAERSSDSQMFFYPVQDPLGYNVPVYFKEYIEAHGGFTVSGAPVEELTSIDGRILQQCYTNVCLNYNPSGLTGQQVRPESLGYTYQSKFHSKSGRARPSTTDTADLAIQVWESYQAVTSDQEQEIGVSVTVSSLAQANLAPVLTITLPDGTPKSYTLPVTGGDGQTRMRLPPIAAPNGTLIPYQVCVKSSGQQNFCVKDSYMIWNNP